MDLIDQIKETSIRNCKDNYNQHSTEERVGESLTWIIKIKKE
jgi:hypothetical protein